MNPAIDFILIASVSLLFLGLGLLGMGLMRLLPKRILEKIEKFHELD